MQFCCCMDLIAATRAEGGLVSKINIVFIASYYCKLLLENHKKCHKCCCPTCVVSSIDCTPGNIGGSQGYFNNL